MATTYPNPVVVLSEEECEDLIKKSMQHSQLASLVDGAYEIVGLWNSDSAKSPANVKWKKSGL